jgi:predicted nucleic acid-binding protein
MSQDRIIADASCLIVLQNIRELSLLQKLFGEVFITEEVKQEFGLYLPEWITVKDIENKAHQTVLSLILDKGEAASIALCLETDNSLLIIDEKKGRRIAQELGLKITGTLGVILQAKKEGSIDSIEDLFLKLENAEFRISEALKAKILESN